MKANAVYGQSGGPTSVINSSFYGVIKECEKSEEIDNLFFMKNGIRGLIENNLKNINEIEKEEIELLPFTPGAICGSVRYKLKPHFEDESDYLKILNTLKKNNIRYIFLNGGNDSMDTGFKLSEFLKTTDYDCKVIGIPKTIDNDLVGTDHTPGYGSAAKFIANSIKSFAYDNECYPKGRVNIVEIMGRDTGWLTASSALSFPKDYAPDLIYVPEIPFDVDVFLNDVKEIFEKNKRCLVAVSEGIKDKNGNFITTMTKLDAFNHAQLGGVCQTLASLVEERLQLPTRAIELSLLQRCFAPEMSLCDRKEAIKCGKKAVKFALNNKTGVMVAIKRENNKTKYVPIKLKKVANAIKYLPREMMNEKGNNITPLFLVYGYPLIDGKNVAPYNNGIIQYADKKKF